MEKIIQAQFSIWITWQNQWPGGVVQALGVKAFLMRR
jgi:hypothetical protein